MKLGRWIAATMLATAVLPARGDEPPQAVDPANVPDTAIVLAFAPDEAGAKAWVKRWKGVRSLLSRLIDPQYGYPAIVPVQELASPRAPPGPFAVVLGYCSAKDASPQLDLLHSIYPEASPVNSSPQAGACPQFHPGAHLVQAKTVEVNGWRLFVGQYLKDPMPADVPVGRKTPHHPNAGTMVILPILFDPAGFMVQYRTPLQYRCVTDELEWPNTCDLEFFAKGNSITVDMKWSQKPHPCSGDLASLHVRSVFAHGGKEIVSKEDVLEREDIPLCD